jgi:hypothetical protein
MVANSHRQFPQLTTKPAVVVTKAEPIPSKPSPIELMQTPPAPAVDQFDAEAALKLMQEAELAEATESDHVQIHEAPRRLSHNELSDAALAELAKHSDDGPRLTLHPEERANLASSLSNVTASLSVNHP